MQDVGIVDGETPRLHLKGDRSLHHLRSHLHGEPKKVVLPDKPAILKNSRQQSQ